MPALPMQLVNMQDNEKWSEAAFRKRLSRNGIQMHEKPKQRVIMWRIYKEKRYEKA